MRSKQRGRGALLRGALGAVLIVAGLNACTSIAGGAALLGAVGIAALTTRCYDYVDVTVLDADGRKTCAATVTASNGKSQFELSSCYYASLTDGRWTLRASLAGTRDAQTTVVVDHEHDCTRYVQSAELTLNRADAAPTPASRPLPTPPAATSAPQPAPPHSAPSSSSQHPTPSAADSAPASSAAAPGSATPSGSATPPVGVFPDSPQTPR
ncbi:MAG TPA: hypothetical protein VHM25_05255 [Polyangiaceae bacterium]|nr:hypothetical protein [Polyangiaceae bacterium]